MRNRTVVVVLTALVTLLAGEAGARALSHRLPVPLTWPDGESQNKVAAMDKLGRRGGASVVLVGSSMTEAAGDPRQLTNKLHNPRPVFNAALNGADLRVLELWTTRVVVPKLHPKTVVIGVSSRELNDNGPQQQRRFGGFLKAPSARLAFGKAKVLDHVELTADQYSDLVRYRAQLRNPYEALTKQFPKDKNTVTPLGALHALLVFSSDQYRFSDAFRQLNTQDTLFHFGIGPVQTGALDRLVTALQRKKIEVVVVEMPITDDEVGLHPHGIDDVRHFEATLNAMVTKRNVRLVNLQPAFTDHSWFADPVHLNFKGRQRFSTLLATALT